MKPQRITYLLENDSEIYEMLESLEETDAFVWLSKSQKGRRYTIRGVPANKIDIVICEKPDVPPAYTHEVVPVLDVANKDGKYDGAIRRRITIRWQPDHQVSDLMPIHVKIRLYDYAAVLRVWSPYSVGDKVHERYSRWRSTLDDRSDLDGIVRWHFGRYYRFLSDFDIREICTQFRAIIESGTYTLAEANRLASRLLYRAARELGFRKLTKREQLRLGLSGQWHAEATYAAAQQKFSSTGESEFSLIATNRNSEIEQMIEIREYR